MAVAGLAGAAELLDSIALYDTTEGARLVATAEGGKLRIVNQAGYDRFQLYGKAPTPLQPQAMWDEIVRREALRESEKENNERRNEKGGVIATADMLG